MLHQYGKQLFQGLNTPHVRQPLVGHRMHVVVAAVKSVAVRTPEPIEQRAVEQGRDLFSLILLKVKLLVVLGFAPFTGRIHKQWNKSQCLYEVPNDAMHKNLGCILARVLLQGSCTDLG